MFKELQGKIKDKKIAVVGAGGLGGNIINLVARLGVDSLLVFDGDHFERSNINRQLFCTLETIGRNKATVGVEEAKKIGILNAHAIPEYFNEEHIHLLKDYDCILDATDNVESRILLENISKVTGITLIHGAINSFFGQVAVVRPGDNTISKLYVGKPEPVRSTLSFVPVTVAALQVCQMVKYLTNSQALESGEVLFVDLFSCEMRIVKI